MNSYCFQIVCNVDLLQRAIPAHSRILEDEVSIIVYYMIFFTGYSIVSAVPPVFNLVDTGGSSVPS